jgi:SulP family sulfate permease
MSALTASLIWPFGPLLTSLQGYSVRKLRRDLVAGLTVSVVEIPQAMAYALIAGVPPQYGIYSSIIQGIVGAIFNSGNLVSVGPTNTQALLAASVVSRVSGGDPQQYLMLVFALSLLKGLMLLGFFALNLGGVVRYVSRSVIIGVSAGAGVLIAVGQIPNLLGVRIPATEPMTLPGVPGQIGRILRHVNEIDWRCVAIGTGCIVVLLVLPRIARSVPAALLAIVLASLWAVGSGWQGQIPFVGAMPTTLPGFLLPPVDLGTMELLLGGALAMAALGTLETVAIAKRLSVYDGSIVEPQRELLSQGLSNVLSGMFQGIPGTGSFARSALYQQSGAATRLALVACAAVIALALLIGGELSKYIPLASLAGILVVIALGLIDWPYLRRIARTNRADFMVAMVTFAATLLAPLEYAIFIGILVNIGVYLRIASRLHLAEMVPTAGGTFLERPLYDSSGNRQVIFLQLEGELFFAVADELHDQLNRLRRSGVRVVILRLKRTHSIDASVLHVLELFARSMQEAGGHVLLCGVRPQLHAMLDRYGLIDLLGRENVFQTGPNLFTSAKRAVERARQLIERSIDTSQLRLDEPEEGIDFQI